MSDTKGISRRDALKLGLSCGAYVMAGGLEVLAQAPLKVPVWTITGTDKAKLMQKALEIIQGDGGFGHAVNKLALKVNAGFARTPEQGATTHPALVKGFLLGCRDFGIKSVSVPEFPCDDPRDAFVKSGINAAVNEAGFTMTAINDRSKSFAPTKIPKGITLHEVDIVDDFLNADATVNMPVCKSHGGAGLSLSLKNWMGSIRERRYWHQIGLPQCVADFATVFRPTWTIIDATRVMFTGGPKGPSDDVRHPNMLIISRDQVAADAYAAIQFWGSISKAKYIGLAAKAGLGVSELSEMDVRKVEL